MNKAKSALLNIFYYDNHVVESLVSIIQMVVIPMYWTRSFGESPSWMMLSLITSGIISMYGSISGKLAWRRAGSILSLIFSACLMISCHRINCEAEVAAAMTVAEGMQRAEPSLQFGTGDSAERFCALLAGNEIWARGVDKVFQDLLISED